MVSALVATALTFIYVMAVAIPHERSGHLQDWLVIGFLTAAAAAYVLWAAVSNGSIVVALLGTTEVLLVAGPGFLLIRAIRHPLALPITLLIAVTVGVAFVYPWTKVDLIRAAIWKRTGLP